jgi:cell division septal protein FtsQ
MPNKRDQFDPIISSPGEYAERHPPRRRTSKGRSPHNSGVTPPISGEQRRRTRATQQRLPYYEADPSGPKRRTRTLAKRLIPDRFGPRFAKVAAALIFFGLLFAGFIFALYLFGGSRFFKLNYIEVEGNRRLSKDDVTQMVREVVPEGVWRVRIKQIRDRLKQNDLIEDTEVTRVLPDKIHVTIKEREPYTLARLGDRLVCVDRSGVMFGNEQLLRGANIPPIISGLVESGENSEEANRQRMMMYQQLLREVDGVEPPLSSRIDEVIFDQERNIRLILKDQQVAVLVGQEDFRTRLNAALDVLDAIRKKDLQALQVLKIEDAQKLLDGGKVAYLNATIPKRVIVGLAE